MSDSDVYDNPLRDCLKSNQEYLRCLDSEIAWRKRLRLENAELRKLIKLALDMAIGPDDEVHLAKVEAWIERAEKLAKEAE